MRQRFWANTPALRVLSLFDTWKTPNTAADLLPDFTRKSVLETIQRLLNLDLLIEKGSEEEVFEKKFKNQWLWPLSARSFHFSTKIQEYSTSEQDKRYFEQHLKGKKQPPIYKSYPNNHRVKLLGRSGFEAPFFATLKKRKTVREFSGQPIGFDQFSTIVRNTWGRSSYYETYAFGRLLHKTSPSAGSRHPIEAYTVINSVAGLEPGLYHYCVEDNSLELLKTRDLREKCVEYCAGQEWTKKASAVFFMTAVVARTQWKYRDPRAYRALLLDAGHLSQTFLLTCNALGLGAFCIGIISDILIEKDLELDGISETALFAVGVGRPFKGKGSRKPLVREVD
jgi:SagB-type dehydrogenase family enzyme